MDKRFVVGTVNADGKLELQLIEAKGHFQAGYVVAEREERFSGMQGYPEVELEEGEEDDGEPLPTDLEGLKQLYTDQDSTIDVLEIPERT